MLLTNNDSIKEVILFPSMKKLRKRERTKLLQGHQGTKHNPLFL